MHFRNCVREYFKLKTSEKQEIADVLGVVQEEDFKKDQFAREKIWLERANAAGQLVVLEQQITLRLNAGAEETSVEEPDILALTFEQIVSLGVTTQDRFAIKSVEGIVYIQVRKPSVLIEHRLVLDKKSGKLVTFRFNDLNKEERQSLIRRIYNHPDFSQSAIASFLDTSQATVSVAIRYGNEATKPSGNMETIND